LTVDVFALLHTYCPVGVTVSIGVGFTVIVNTCTGPRHALAVGVTVNTPFAGALPVFVAVNEPIADPLPDPPIPIVVLLFAHVYVVPETSDTKLTVDVFALLHTYCPVGVTVSIGVGLT
jgi:hypothetical protein